jgi:4-alpha-glucanotransferase
VHRDGAAIAKLEKVARQQIVGIKVLQFLFHHQWHALQSYASEKGVRLFGDMPIYVALDSADAWAHPELLRIDRDGKPDYVAGVPPDYFSDDGQLWGNPLYDWDQHAANGFTWWTERLRHAISLADLVRIDHFRGFAGFWSVPAESRTARDGRWEAGPGAAVFEAMHNALGDLPIVAEDLGVITPAVESLRDRYQIPGMKVLQFEVTKADFDVADIGENCVCYTGTHDNDTTVGWFHGSRDDTRTKKDIAKTREIVLELTNGRPENIHNDLVKLAFGSKAKVAIAPIQDYLGLGSESRLNTPGTISYNWRWRLLQGRLTPELCESVREMVSSSGRGIAD